MAVQINLIWNQSAQWLLFSGVCKFYEFYYGHVLGHVTWRPNEHETAYLQAKAVPINLILSESARWLLSFGIHQIPEAFVMAMSMSIWAQWANDHDVAYPQTKTVPM